MDTCYCPFLFIVDVVIINNILSQNLSAQYQKDIFLQAHSICA